MGLVLRVKRVAFSVHACKVRRAAFSWSTLRVYCVWCGCRVERFGVGVGGSGFRVWRLAFWMRDRQTDRQSDNWRNPTH